MRIFILILLGCLPINPNMFSKTVENTLEKLSVSPGKTTESNFYVSKGKRLLEWNKEKLTSRSDLSVNDIKELFAPEFVVIANGRTYDANYQNYYEFLNKFRSDIDTLEYEVQEYIIMESTVVMPLKATVKLLQGKMDVFDAILIIKLNDLGKIVHWQEVYSKR
jgi:putative sterol carrier protein